MVLCVCVLCVVPKERALLLDVGVKKETERERERERERDKEREKVVPHIKRL